MLSEEMARQRIDDRVREAEAARVARTARPSLEREGRARPNGIARRAVALAVRLGRHEAASA